MRESEEFVEVVWPSEQNVDIISEFEEEDKNSSDFDRLSILDKEVDGESDDNIKTSDVQDLSAEINFAELKDEFKIAYGPEAIRGDLKNTNNALLQMYGPKIFKVLETICNAFNLIVNAQF